jgi:hypothetical protein
MRRTSAVVWGIVFILLGGLLVLDQIGIFNNIRIFSWGNIWAIGMLLLGIIFHVQFFVSGGKNPGILVPGGILLVYGCMHMYIIIVGWQSMGVLWPLYLVGPGFGLLELKVFSRGKEGSWVPVIILFTLAILFFLKNYVDSFWMLAAVALIIIGVAIILGSIFGSINNKSKKQESEVHVDVDEN